MNLAARSAACKMLRDAKLPENDRDIHLLHDDIMLIANKDYGDTYAVRQATALLTKRIGGLVNLEPYLACLRVQA